MKTKQTETMDVSPQSRTIRIKQRAKGGEENSVIVDGCELGSVLSGFSIHCNANDASGGLPTVELELLALDLDVTIDGIVSLDTARIPDELARKMHETLNLRFGTPNCGQWDKESIKEAKTT